MPYRTNEERMSGMSEAPDIEQTIEDFERTIREALPGVQTQIVVSDPALDSERWLWVTRGDHRLFVVSEDGWAFGMRRNGSIDPRAMPLEVAINTTKVGDW